MAAAVRSLEDTIMWPFGKSIEILVEADLLQGATDARANPSPYDAVVHNTSAVQPGAQGESEWER